MIGVEMEDGFAVVRLVKDGWRIDRYFFGAAARLEADARCAALNVSSNYLEWAVFSARRSPVRTALLWEFD